MIKFTKVRGKFDTKNNTILGGRGDKSPSKINREINKDLSKSDTEKS